ncbi:Integral membrane protein [hydrothermal vent metagenome]|uniref:Integral membrane protein n=1 Tax=hydrothermal vent metagenome TaxID=652676 RepID=A0A1W1BVV6_9ZZZZ
MKHFYSSIVVAIIGLVIAFYLGSWYGLYITALLAILEVSLSFDNAVVNAKILETMEPKWQKRFITWGIPFAVFGMRFIFPIVIVAVAGNLGVIETFNLALNNPDEYQSTLESVETLIYAFGGSFLLMVFLDFIFDVEREEKWIKIIEGSKLLHKAGNIDNIDMIVAIPIGLILVYLTSSSGIALAYFGGIFLHSLIASLDELLGTDGVRSGIMGFLYLEVLDASFSFDGVIGSFALSSNIFIIMIGLGIGAMFVRSLTLYFVEKKTLTEYRYLEHGAHYAILALSLIMFAKMFVHINEVIVGTIGVSFIAIATYHSILANKKEKEVH